MPEKRKFAGKTPASWVKIKGTHTQSSLAEFGLAPLSSLLHLQSHKSLISLSLFFFVQLE